MIVFGDTGLADAAMLATRWFEQFTGSADLAWVEQNVVVGVLSHLGGMFGGGY